MQVEQGAPTVQEALPSRSILSTAVLALATLFCILRPLSIDVPGAGLDASWAVVLGEAAMLPARWGVDLTFTYGPASALVTRYFTGNYLTLALPLICAISISYAFCFACLIGSAAAGRSNAGLLTIVAVAGQGLALLVMGEKTRTPSTSPSPSSSFSWISCVRHEILPLAVAASRGGGPGHRHAREDELRRPGDRALRLVGSQGGMAASALASPHARVSSRLPARLRGLWPAFRRSAGLREDCRPKASRVTARPCT